MDRSGYSQCQKVLAIMCINRDNQWWFAVDFQKPTLPRDLFVGYEASARMSDLFRMSPALFNKGKQGKYRVLKVRFEEVDKLYPNLPDELKVVLRDCKIINRLF